MSTSQMYGFVLAAAIVITLFILFLYISGQGSKRLKKSMEAIFKQELRFNREKMEGLNYWIFVPENNQIVCISSELSLDEVYLELKNDGVDAIFVCISAYGKISEWLI